MDELENKKVVAEEAIKALLTKLKDYLENGDVDALVNYATKNWVQGQFLPANRIWKGTKEQYSALSNYDNDTLYFITES